MRFGPASTDIALNRGVRRRPRPEMMASKEHIVNTRLWTTACAICLLVGSGSGSAQDRGPGRDSRAGAQNRSDRNRQGQTQFNAHDQQTTRDWYAQHQTRPPTGFRPQDRLSPDQETRLQPGRALEPDLQRRVHPVPRTLSRQLPAPPRNHQYVAIGGHVGLMDRTTRVLRDIIHLH
jgi:Ni/Co efflux regulator RcnB